MTSPIQTSLIPTLPRLRSLSGIRYETGGEEVIDLSGQTLNLILGQPANDVVNQVKNTIDSKKIFFSSRFGSDEFENLSNLLIAIAPKQITKINLKLTNGSDAVETALKIAWQNQRTRKTMLLPNAWHGETITTLGLSSKTRSQYVSATNGDFCFAKNDDIHSLCELVSNEKNPATVILDPIGFSSGLFNPEQIKSDLLILRALCDKNGHILIFDEVQTFGGWLGEGFFAYDKFSVCPDIIAIGKALGHGFPIAGCLFSNKLAELMYNEAEFTYGGQPPACTAAITGIEWTRSHSDLIKNSLLNWERVCHLLKLKFDDCIVKSIGFITTISNSDPHRISLLYKFFLTNCIIARVISGNKAIAFKCPINFSQEDADFLIEKLNCKLARPADEKIINILWRENKNIEYANSLTRHFGIYAYQRSILEQKSINEKILKLGIPSPHLYQDTTLWYREIPGKSLDLFYSSNVSEIKNILGQILDYLYKSHGAQIIIGDRWAGNSVWDGAKVHFIDYDVGYFGDVEVVSCFEIIFAIFHHSTIISTELNRVDILRPYVLEWVRNFGQFSCDMVYKKFKDFYSNFDKPENETSMSKSYYLALLSDFDKILKTN